ncbi:hypothetical protein F5Y05DRAFT_193231 [Hypoxylon sp. FL0543]|nr:hypothetical protein F5Y05DRAFT_193231 [Hypoxylon sp. FL0543]
MSGFEIAGVILGAIPLLISALEHYKANKGILASFVKWDGQLDTLVERLEDQRLSFYFDILELLQGAGVEDVVSSDYVPEEMCVSILFNMRNEAEIKEYFGAMHDRFLKILGRYERCLKIIVSKLTHIYRPPNVAKDDLAAIIAANKPGKGLFAFKQRVKFTIEKGSLKELIEELREDGLSLKIIIKGMKTQREYTAKQPPHDAEKLATIFERVQTNATPLFAMMCRVCICKCPTKHKVLIRLDNRMHPQKGRSSLRRKTNEQTIFSLVFEFEEYLQEALVRASEGEETWVEDAEVGKQDATMKLPTVTFTPVMANPTRDDNGSDLKKATKVTDICHQASKARSSGHILRLQLTRNDLHLLEGPSQSRRDVSTSMSLEELLQDGVQDRNARMNPKQKTLLALDIAASVLQLRQTRWFVSPFASKNIKFPLKKAGTSKTAVPEPFVGQVMEEIPSKGSGVDGGGPDPKTALLELAILLLETWHDKPLELWMTRLGMTSAESEEARRRAAVLWEEETESHLPPHHLTAIDYCLGICGGRKRFWHDDDFLRQYCENVIKPLYESSQAWTDSAWYQAMITYRSGL